MKHTLLPSVRTPQGLRAAALARRFGLANVAALLEQAAGSEPTTPQEQLLAACAVGDAAQARRLAAAHPGLLQGLAPEQLRMLPELAGSRVTLLRSHVDISSSGARRHGAIRAERERRTASYST